MAVEPHERLWFFDDSLRRHAPSRGRTGRGASVLTEPNEHVEPPSKIAGNILVVDDDPFASRAFARLVRSAGGTAVLAGTRAAALALFDTEWKGLIVDILLPDGSGLDLIEPARIARPNARVLVVTGSDTPNFANTAHLLGVEYVRKPEVTANVNAFLARCASNSTDRISLIVAELSSAYRLTEAEARVVAASVESARKSTVAGRLGVKRSTAKTQMAAVLRKTGFGSIEDLAAAIRARLLS